MTRAGGRSTRLWIFVGSIAAHVAFFAVIAALPSRQRSEVVTIDFADLKRRKEAPRPPTEAAPPPKARPRISSVRVSPPAPAKVAPTPAKSAVAPARVGAEGFADLGAVPVGGGVKGSAAGAVGFAPGTGASVPKATAHKVRQLAPTPQDECAEAVVKPRVKTPGLITYTKEGQEAEIEGPVRVQVTVDEQGRVIAAAVLTGLGFGLDQRALAAAKETVFDPATACGRPVVATKILVFDFELR